MEFKNTLLAVRDMQRSLDFYARVLGLQVVLDFGANKTLSGGLCLQTADSFSGFIDGKPIGFGGHDFELYFEEADFDGFISRLQGMEMEYLHPVKEHRWGQRVVRFYDPDRHIVEVGEKMNAVCRRFVAGGLSPEQAAARMEVPLSYVEDSLRDPEQ